MWAVLGLVLLNKGLSGLEFGTPLPLLVDALPWVVAVGYGVDVLGVYRAIGLGAFEADVLHRVVFSLLDLEKFAADGFGFHRMVDPECFPWTARAISCGSVPSMMATGILVFFDSLTAARSNSPYSPGA